MLNHSSNKSLEWNVFSGPNVKESEILPGWSKKDCSIDELAQLLHDSNEPVVVVNGYAELGPRALGNRSIIAAPVRKEMKSILNYVKNREDYRPVSPICLESESAKIFEPGGYDPYMLFDHIVKEDWVDRIPAVIHLDGSARLQTMSNEQNPITTALLESYYRISNIPLLCNTSANYNGKGFFPDVKSVMEWGRVNYIWSNETLYEKEDKQDLYDIVEKEVKNCEN